MRLFLYRRATKNMAAPYARAPTMAPLATIALVELTLRLAPISPPMAPPSPPYPSEVDAGSAAPLGELFWPGAEPTARGQAVLMRLVRSLTVESLLCQNTSAGLRSCAASLVSRSLGMVNRAKVVMNPWYCVVSKGFSPRFRTSDCGMLRPSAIAFGK